MAGFLVVAGLTGSVLAFYYELDELSNPSLYHASPPTPGAALLDPLELRDRLMQKVAGIQVDTVELEHKPGEAVTFYISGGKNEDTLTNDDEFFVDPYTGAILGSRKWGDITQGWKNFVPFVYRLHYELALGTFGQWVMGLAALVWTLDCFVGFYLTLPIRRRANPKRPPAVHRQLARSWWARWMPAWKVKTAGSSYRINFDLHRAGGLWLWAMLFVIAWSSVAFNLSTQVYEPVMKLMFDMREHADAIPELEKPLRNPPIGFVRAREIGHRHMLGQAKAQGFETGNPSYLSYDADKAIYYYGFASSADIRDDGTSSVIFSAINGKFLAVYLPNREAAGVQVTTWIMGLHMARIGGLPMQVFICVMGLIVIMLSSTGIVVWARKRRARQKQNRTVRGADNERLAT
ncbi:MAG: PepSY domain-containing protein [Hyphomicrobiaceae bacterium]|nr:PepSY domain-containing protein [Hyphomicrobiaceae bacterium]